MRKRIINKVTHIFKRKKKMKLSNVMTKLFKLTRYVNQYTRTKDIVWRKWSSINKHWNVIIQQVKWIIPAQMLTTNKANVCFIWTKKPKHLKNINKLLMLTKEITTQCSTGHFVYLTLVESKKRMKNMNKFWN